MKGEHLGELEELVLLAVCAMDGEAYGVSVQQTIRATVGRDVAIGAVYSALDRLQRKELLRSRWGARGTDRGGRRKRCFAATASGRAALESARGAREALWRLVEPSDG